MPLSLSPPSKRPIPNRGIIVSANSADTDYVVAEFPASELRRILSSPKIHQMACFEALSAKLRQEA
ncbi:hypothetical protein PanWU01x14_367190 [Parasponia andersonii]|uniref:Uncharacterized protein n=1 Tax=Parasponia andersonii TaxID=3476 RepID=A0A2P5A5F6_PARAD|nr:hypothetical protein PanWU01x14_367190 [Parasponia andersonii]